MIRFQCPVCKTVMSVPDTDAGRKGDCPKCGQRLQIPSVPAKPVVSPPAHVPPQATAPGQGAGRMPPALPSSRQSPPPRRHEQPRPARLPESKVQARHQPPPIPARGETGAGARDAARDFLKAIGKRAAAKVKEVAASARQVAEAKTQARDQRAAAPPAAGMVPAMPKRRLWPWLLAGALGLFLMMSCAGIMVIGLGISSMDWKLPVGAKGGADSSRQGFLDGLIDWKLPVGAKGGADSYESVEEMARDFESVYLPGPVSLGNCFEKPRPIAIGINNEGKCATIYCQNKGKLEKLTNDSLAAMIHDPNLIGLYGERVPSPTIRLSYTLKGNRIDGDVGFKSNMLGLERAPELHSSFSYDLTDDIKYKGKGTKERGNRAGQKVR